MIDDEWEEPSSFGMLRYAEDYRVAAENVIGDCNPLESKLLMQAKAFVRLRRPSYFLFAWPKRKITKENGHPAWRLPPILGRQVRASGPGFSNGLLPVRKGTDVLSVPATRPVVPASPSHRGPG